MTKEEKDVRTSDNKGCPLVEIVTCKDCFYYNIDEDGRGYHCEKYGHTRFPVYADFYCADAKRRE